MLNKPLTNLIQPMRELDLNKGLPDTNVQAVNTGLPFFYKVTLVIWAMFCLLMVTPKFCRSGEKIPWVSYPLVHMPLFLKL